MSSQVRIRMDMSHHVVTEHPIADICFVRSHLYTLLILGSESFGGVVHFQDQSAISAYSIRNKCTCIVCRPACWFNCFTTEKYVLQLHADLFEDSALPWKPYFVDLNLSIHWLILFGTVILYHTLYKV